MMATTFVSRQIDIEQTRCRLPEPNFPSELRFIQRRSLHELERTWVEESAYRWGAVPESYDVACSDGEILKSPCGTGLVNVYQDGRYCHIPGGLIGPPETQNAMIGWLKSQADSQRRTLAVYSIGNRNVEEFRSAGFAINKFGEEPILDLASLDWKGKAFEWVRRQTHACERVGLEVVEIRCPQAQMQLSNELDQIHDDDLSRRVYSKPLRLLEGEFNGRLLRRRRLFVVRDQATNRMEGFLAASPMRGGQAWAFETYRKRPTAPRGVVPFLFRKVVDQLKQEGVEQVSLCLVPGKGVADDQSKECDRRVRWLLKLWYGHLNFLFNTAGQDFFKSRFRPRYEARYLCVYPRFSIQSIFSFLKVVGALSINWRNLCDQMISRRH